MTRLKQRTRVSQARARWSLAGGNNGAVNLFNQFQKVITFGQQFERPNLCKLQVANSFLTAGDELVVRERSGQFQIHCSKRDRLDYMSSFIMYEQGSVLMALLS